MMHIQDEEALMCLEQKWDNVHQDEEALTVFRAKLKTPSQYSVQAHPFLLNKAKMIIDQCILLIGGKQQSGMG